jgi:toxin-antitoxin system PIN domain toxin
LVSVILADTNFWLALSLSKHVFHAAARNWFAARSRASSVLFCRSTQQSFLRLLTTEAATRPYDIPPMTNAAAWAIYQRLSSDRRIAWAAEPKADAVNERWRALAARESASPKLWMDAYLAAFAVVGGHDLVTTDKAFAQFTGLQAIILTAAPPKS